MSDLISVIVPIYRVENYLSQCIQSIINQTYKNLEIILVDDGSDDRCGEICDSFAEEDSRIKVIHKKNEGLDCARKTGILSATGKYIGYVDGDDWIEPDMYETLIEKAKKYDVAVVESGVIDSWEDNEKKRYPYLKEGCYKGEEFVSKVMPICIYSGDFFEHGVSPYLGNKLFLKEAVYDYQLVPGPLSEYLNDNLVAHPTVMSAKSLYVVHKCLIHYRVNLNSLKRFNRKDTEEMYAQFYQEFKLRLGDVSLNSKVDKQIKYFCLYYGLFNIPHIFDDISNNIFLRPYGGISANSKIILYGAGPVGIHLKTYIDTVPQIKLVCWVDRNYKSLGEKLQVQSPDCIKECEYDYIIISILRKSAVESVYNNLKEMKIPKDKILWIDENYLNNPEKLLGLATYKGKLLFPYF